jgi:hypothetical protein
MTLNRDQKQEKQDHGANVPFFLMGRTESLLKTGVGIQWTSTFEGPEGIKPEL